MVRSTSEQSAVQRVLRAAIKVTCAALVGTVALPVALAGQGEKPQTHTVKPGDTLWGLARQYLNDPFLWPEIYRMNTAVVEDPHWIYPGEVLRLAGGDAVASVPTTDTPPPDSVTVAVAIAEPRPAQPAIMKMRPSADSADMSPLFSQTRRTDMMRETLRAYSDQPYRALRRSEFYSSGFLTERQELPFGHVAARVQPLQIRSVSSRASMMLYADIVVTPPDGATYQVGDSLLIAMLGPDVDGFGRIVRPTGLARVTDISNGLTVASVVAVYGAIRTEQVVLPVERFTESGSVRAVPVADGVQTHVLAGLMDQVLKKPQDVLFIDKGRSDGVAVGDIFEVRRSGERPGGGKAVPEVMATLQVVRVGEHTASTRIIWIASPDLRPGVEARQIAKLPS